MTELNRKILAACADVEKQIAALQVWLAAAKLQAQTVELKDWGELGDVTNVRDLLNQIPAIGGEQ